MGTDDVASELFQYQYNFTFYNKVFKPNGRSYLFMVLKNDIGECYDPMRAKNRPCREAGKDFFIDDKSNNIIKEQDNKAKASNQPASGQKK